MEMKTINTTRIIFLAIGVLVAIMIAFTTGLFGMTQA
jgi:hypothetical protein